VPSVICHLHSKKPEEKAVLVLDHCPAHPSSDVLKSKDEEIKAMFLPTNTTALIQPMDQGIILACKAYCHCELLGGVVNSELLGYLGEKLRQVVLQTPGKSVLENMTSR
jgi:hypothetical protein